MKKYRIGFIGYGNMAKAIAKGLAKIKEVGYISAFDPYYTESNGIVIPEKSAQELIFNNDIIFLSIKPQVAQIALNGLNFADKTIVSIMAGKSIKSIKELCDNAERLVRVMPNLCARIGKSVNAYCYVGLNESEAGDIQKILSAFGLAVNLEEKYFDVITGLTGSSPAYSFRYAKSLTEAGVRNGLSFQLAKDLALYSVSSSVELLSSANSLEEMQIMIDNVCSKGGTTIEGIYKLNEGNFDELIISAINSAIEKSRELSAK